MLAASLQLGGRRDTTPSLLTKALNTALSLFVLSCVFDPADRLFGMKIWTFLLCWGVGLLAATQSNRRFVTPPSLLLYAALFVFVPTLSVVVYQYVDGNSHFEGFNLLKGYILITLAPLLVLCRVDLIPRLSAILTGLAIVIIGTFVAIQLFPELYAVIALFGEATGVVVLDTRDYGDDLSLLQIYFVTSPMLAVSIAFYFGRLRSATSLRAKLIPAILTATSIAGMFLAGTRNNILVSITLPMTLWFLYSRSKALSTFLAMAAATTLALVFSNEIGTLLDPTEFSNSIKLALLDDYARFLSDPRTLLIGQGLGSFQHWDAKSSYFYISELTYLELIRNFGLVGAALMFVLLLHPIWHESKRGTPRRRQAIAVAYAFYLMMCITNPNLFSSMGVLILSAILARIYLPPFGRTHALARRLS